MTTVPVLFECKDSIARIRFDRPEALNALSQEMVDAFLGACRALADMRDVRVVVLSGAGRAFMAGGDLARFSADLPAAGKTATALIQPLHEALAILADLPLPVVASVQGAVAGAGVSVALVSDICIAAEDTKFNLAYARIGASPDASASWSLPRAVGLRKALELMLLADSVEAMEAQRIGIVSRVVPLLDLPRETDALVQRLAAGPTFAYGQAKRLMRTSFERGMKEQMAAEHEAFCACTGTADFAEGINSFFGKRQPRFTGK